MTNGAGSGNDAGSRGFDQLQFMDRLVGYTKQKGVVVIKRGCD